MRAEGSSGRLASGNGSVPRRYEPVSRQGTAVPRGTVPVVFAISATGILANPLVLPVLPDLARDLGVAPGTAGLAISVASLPGVVVAPVIGLLADRYGRRTVIAPCLLVFGVAGLAGALAPTFPLLLVARFAQGVGSAGLINLAVVILGDHFTGPERARMIGLNAVVLTTGLSTFPTLGGALAEQWGWRASFAPFGVAFLVAGAVLTVLSPVRPRGSVTVREQVREAAVHARDRRVLAMAVAGFLVFIFVFGVSTTLPVHLDQEFDADALARGLVLALPAAGAGAVSLSMGRLASRWGAWDLAPVGFGMIAAAYLGVAGAPVIGLVTLPALAYGMGEGLTVVPLQYYATAIAPDEHRGVIVALWVSAVRAGQAVGPALAAVSISALGTQGTFVAGSALAVSVATFAGFARPSLKLRDTARG